MVLIVKMSVFEYLKMDTIKLDKKRQMKFSFKKLFVAFYTVNLNNMHIIKKHVKNVSYIHLWMRAFFRGFLAM